MACAPIIIKNINSSASVNLIPDDLVVAGTTSTPGQVVSVIESLTSLLDSVVVSVTNGSTGTMRVIFGVVSPQFGQMPIERVMAPGSQTVYSVDNLFTMQLQLTIPGAYSVTISSVRRDTPSSKTVTSLPCPDSSGRPHHHPVCKEEKKKQKKKHHKVSFSDDSHASLLKRLRALASSLD